MKSITKILTLLTIFLLVPSLTLATGTNNAGNATVNDNYTIGTSTTNTTIDEPGTSTTIEENTSVDSTPLERVATPPVRTPPEHPSEKVLPSREDVLAFAQNSNATDNATLEEQLIAHNESWYWDTYVVKTTNEKEYTIVVVYDNEKTKTDYGRVQLYVRNGEVYLVKPEPMLICKSLSMISKDGKGNFATASVKSYKIVKSYFGVDKKPVANPVVTEEKQLGCVVNNATVPVKENQIIDSAAQVIENTSIENSTVTQNAGDQSNNTNSVNNSKGVIQNQGNGNSFLQYLLDLSHTNWQNVTLSINNYFK